MSFIDYYAQVAAATAFDLGSKKSGPGEPIVCLASNQTPGALITVTTAPDNAGAAGTPVALTTATVGADGSVEFRLPSTTLQWITSDVAIDIVMEGNQTNT